MQDILAHLTQVDEQVAAIVAGIALVLGIDKGVQQPELDILDVGSLEVVGVQLAHHASPPVVGIVQLTVKGNVRRQVVRASLLGIVCQVEHVQRIGGTAIGALVTVGIELVHIDGSYIVVAQLVQVTLDVAGRQAGGAIGEQRVDVIPRQESTVVTAIHGVNVGVLCEVLRNTGDDPRLGFRNVDAILRTLKVVNVRGVVLRTACRSGYQLRELTGEGDLRGLGTVQQGQLVEHSREPLALRFPVDVQTPQGVFQWFRAHRHLRSQCLLAQMLQGTAYLEILREVVFPVESEHSFALHAVLRIALQRYIDLRPCIQDALVKDGHLACRIIDAIVGTFLQDNATCRDYHRALRHVIGAQRDDIG